jgi:MFS transporter, DHA1 family, staphyloferrin A biosynthesis exporter
VPIRQTLARRVEFLSILENRNFRVYAIGLVSSVMGQQMLIATQAWLVYYLTGSPAALGLVGAVHAIPGLAVTLIGGALADRWNPRNIVLAAQSSSGLVMGTLATLVVLDMVAVWHIVVASFLTGLAQAFDSPARRTIWPPMIRRDQYLFAISITQTVWNGTRIIAPGAAGLIIAIVARTSGEGPLGAGISLYLTFLGFLTMAIAMTMIKLPPVQRSTGASVFHDIADGLRFVARNRVYTYLLGISLASGYFGLSYMWLMPVFAEEYLHVAADGYGVLLSVGGLGAMSGVLAVASFGQYQDRPWLLIGGALFGGGLVVAFSVTSALFESYGLALFLMFWMGASFAVFQVATGTTINLLVPDEYRGRVLGLRGIMFSLAPLGSLQAGLIATATNTPFAVGLGGAVLAVFALATYVVSADIRRLPQLVAEATEEHARKAAERSL